MKAEIVQLKTAKEAAPAKPQSSSRRRKRGAKGASNAGLARQESNTSFTDTTRPPRKLARPSLQVDNDSMAPSTAPSTPVLPSRPLPAQATPAENTPPPRALATIRQYVQLNLPAQGDTVTLARLAGCTAFFGKVSNFTFIDKSLAAERKRKLADAVEQVEAQS